MLRLIEEDADSFAQRAEMYYQKRPELVNLVEEFYRAYRSLAERYDHLTGEIRHNIPRALQVQYGLSCDSPKSAGPGGRRHHYSPLRKSNQTFESLLQKACQSEGQMKKAVQPEDQMQSLHGEHPKQGSFDDPCIEHSKRNGRDDPCIELHNSPDGDLASSSDSEVDNLTPLNKLQQEIESLEKENKMLADSHQKTLELNTALQSKLKALEDVHGSTWMEVDTLRNKVVELSKDLLLLKMENTTRRQVDEILASNLLAKEVQEVLPFLEEEPDPSAGEEDVCGCDELGKDADVAEGKHNHCVIRFCTTQEQSVALLKGLQDQVALLMEENRKQKLAILERGEEKREAIRQLCFSMDVLKSKNERLQLVLGLLKQRLHASSAAATTAVSWPPFPAWKTFFFMGDQRGTKAAQPFAVAL